MLPPGTTPSPDARPAAADSGAPVVEVRGVTFGYGRDVILEDVDLTIRRGDYMAVIGPNGGGKTTLLRLILGLETPWRGEIVRHLSQRRGSLGWVPQFAGFDRHFPLTVRQVVMMGRLGLRSLLSRHDAADHAAVAAELERFRLDAVADAPIGALSGGQLQRALIARALVGEPEILLLDEPIASIDRTSRRILLDTLEELNRHVPVVVVTHDVTLFTGTVRQIACVNRRLHLHPGGTLDHAELDALYGAPVELVSHGPPPRVVLEEHDDG